MEETIIALKQRLHTLRQTARYLLEQAHAFGGEVYLPSDRRHSLDDTRSNIAECIKELRSRGVDVDVQPEDKTFLLGSILPLAAHRLLDLLPIDHIPPHQTLPTPHRMPLLPNPLFVGRENDICGLASALKSGGTLAVTTGIGGMGKTQLASEVVHRYGAYFAGGVFWVSFADPTAIAGEIAACGEIMGLSLSGLDLDKQVRLTRAAWENNIPRLLVFDNCEDELTLHQWMPKTGSCRVIVTSRKDQWNDIPKVQIFRLEQLSLAESVSLLSKHRVDLDRHEAEVIADELGNLPLALHLAGSFLAKYRTISARAYLTNLRSSAILDHPSLQGRQIMSMPTEVTPHVARVFALSFEQLKPNHIIDKLALELLSRAACLAPGEPFSRSLLISTLEPPDNEEMPELVMTDALYRLTSLGLLETVSGEQLRLHRLLVIYAGRTRVDTTALPAVERAIHEAASDANKKGLPTAMLPVLSHLRFLVRQVCDTDRMDVGAALLLNSLGYYLNMVGEYGEAQSLFERALYIREKMLGNQHLDTATSINNLAALYYVQEQFSMSQKMFEQALQVRQTNLGVYHPDTAQSMSNLALIYWIQKQYSKALSLMERSIQIYEQTLGLNHPDTATSLNNLACMYCAQRKYNEASLLFDRSIKIYEQVLEQEHPLIATSLDNLAYLYELQGQILKALLQCEQVLAIQVRNFGPDHPSTRRVRETVEMLRRRLDETL